MKKTFCVAGVEGWVVGSPGGKGWDWRENYKIVKSFECHLEEFKPDVGGEFVCFFWFCLSMLWVPRTLHLLFILKDSHCWRTPVFLASLQGYHTVPSSAHCLARCWPISLPDDVVLHTVGMQQRTCWIKEWNNQINGVKIFFLRDM